MSRLLVLFIVGLAFGAAARVLQWTGVLVEGGIYASALAFGIGVAAALVAIVLANYVKENRSTLHPRY